MIEKKDPDRKIGEDDLSDDDPVIDLTDEVILKPEKGHKAAPSKTEALSPPKVEKDPSLGDDESMILFEENAKSSLQDDPFTKTDGNFAENDNRIGFTDNFDPDASGDDDVFIMDNGQNEVDGDSTAIIDEDSIELIVDETPNSYGEENELEFVSEGDEIDFFNSDDDRAEDNGVITMPSDASSKHGEDDNGIDMLTDMEFEREEGEELHPSAELDNVDDEADDDIIEITEFDRHYPDDDEDLEHYDILDRSGLEDADFLELFGAEEDLVKEDEEMRELSDSEEKAVEAKMSRFFDDALENETGTGNSGPQPAEIFSELDTDLDLAMTAAALSSGAGKIDRSDTPSLQDPTNEKEAASLPRDQSERGEHMQKDSSAFDTGSSSALSSEQIDRAIERIINEKFAGRIEHIIYEIIEKAVKREIDRLKESLLEDHTPKDVL